MKKRIVETVMSIMVLLTVVGCTYNGTILEEEILQNKYKAIAGQYVENLIIRGKVADGMSLKSDEYPSFLKNAIELAEVNSMKSEEDLFFKVNMENAVNDWKSFEVERIAKRFEEYPALAEMTSIENEIELRTILELPENYTMNDYINIRQEKVNEYLVGHAALMCENVWNSSWNNDPNAFTSISAWTFNKYATWPNMLSCVQYEPLGYWTGSHGGEVETTIIYDVAGASDNDYYEAVYKAKSFLGKPYNIVTLKGPIDSFYCSKLVWKSWYLVNEKYDLDANGGIYVLPCDIGNSPLTKPLVSYNH